MSELYQVRGGKAVRIDMGGDDSRVPQIIQRVDELEKRVDTIEDGGGGGGQPGTDVTLSDAVDSDSSTTAASSKAVKTAYDKAVTAQSAANTADSKAQAAQSAAQTAQSAAETADGKAEAAQRAAEEALASADAAKEAASSGDTTGNAATATKLQTARTISLIGAVTGSASFDGSEDITITTSGGSAAGISSVNLPANYFLGCI